MTKRTQMPRFHDQLLALQKAGVEVTVLTQANNFTGHILEVLSDYIILDGVVELTTAGTMRRETYIAEKKIQAVEVIQQWDKGG